MLHLTPKMLERGYDLLRASPPFSRWRLPHPDDVTFHVFAADWGADYHFGFDPPAIRVSQKQCGQLQTLLCTISHELIHMRQHQLGHRINHGAEFQRLANQVCRIHGFDRAGF